jgi:glucose-6-phosphate isomerase
MKEIEVYDLPVSVQIDTNTGEFTPCPEKIDRKVSDLAAMFYDQAAVKQIIDTGDRVVYEIRYYPFITSKSDMALGTTVIFPGTVGGEYHMTKGHFHASDDQPEIYYCVQGEGLLLMESRDGDYRVAPWKAGTITHIPPQYAHRVVNTGSTPLVFVASFHVAAGHDYEQIEAQGFKHLVVERDGQAVEIPNPRWGV